MPQCLQIMTVDLLRPATGIAIGPILFVVAILAVLIGAIAAGTGGFSSSTSTETSRLNASAVIEQGANLKAAFERLRGSALEINEIVWSPSYSTANATKALYSMTGGGLSVMLPPANTAPTTGVINWRFANNAGIPGMGLAGGELITAIGIKTSAICKAINAIVFGKTATVATTLPDASAATVTLNDTGTCTDVTVDTTTSGCNLAVNQFDLSSVTSITGYSQACVAFDASTFYYFQILLIK